MSEEQLVVFRLGKEEYALSISSVREIIQYQGATEIPNSLDYVEGIINLRGKLIPVIELAAKFGLEVKTTPDKRAVIVETVDQVFAVIVNEVTEVKQIEENKIEVVQGMSIGTDEYIRGIAKDGTRLIIILNADKIMCCTDFEVLRKSSDLLA